MLYAQKGVQLARLLKYDMNMKNRNHCCELTFRMGALASLSSNYTAVRRWANSPVIKTSSTLHTHNKRRVEQVFAAATYLSPRSKSSIQSLGSSKKDL